MTRVHRLAGATVMALAIGTSAAAQAPAAARTPPGDAAVGRQLYMKQTCFFCHGTAAQGSITGPRLAAIARTLDGFTRYVRRPSGSMPAFTDRVIPDQDLAAIFSYLKSLPPAKPVADIPLLERLKQK